jgi:hypothetical protein
MSVSEKTYRIFTLKGRADWLVEGAEVEEFILSNGTAITAVAVGETGRGRSLGLLPINANKGRFVTLVTIGTTKAGHPRLFVSNGKPTDDEAIVVWKLEGGYRGSLSYTPNPPGRVLAQGNTAQGDAGRMGSSLQLVTILPISTPVRVEYSGRLYGADPAHTIELHPGGVLDVATDLEIQVRNATD